MNASIYAVAAGFGPRRGRMGGHRFGAVVIGLLLVAGIVTLAILLYRSRNRPMSTVAPPLPPVPAPGAPWPVAGPGAAMTPASNAEMILSERLARGEVSVDDFVAARAALRGETMPSRVTSTDVIDVPQPPAPDTI